MSQCQRQQRLRLLVKKLNKERKRQASKIDILCNDLINAQRGFVKQLNDVRFAAHFYKSLLGVTYLPSLLTRAGQMIQSELPGVGVTFFLRSPEGCQRHIFDGNEALHVNDQLLEDYFHPQLAENICKSNRLCMSDDMFAMGFEGNPNALRGVSLVTLPLNDLGRALGFILLYRSSAHPLMADELNTVGLITCGLSHAIAECPMPAHF